MKQQRLTEMEADQYKSNRLLRFYCECFLHMFIVLYGLCIVVFQLVPIEKLQSHEARIKKII